MNKDEVVDDKNLGQLITEANVLQLMIEQLQKQLEFINTSVSEVQSAIVALEELKTCSEESEILVAVGAGTLIKVRYTPDTKVMVPLGSSVFIEVSTNEAQKILERRLEKLNSVQVENRKQLSYAISRLNEIEPKIRVLLHMIKEHR